MGLENARWRLEFDPATGALVRLLDKRENVVVIDAPACVPVVIDDPADTWAHGQLRFDAEIGRFGEARFTVVENGPVRATLRVDQRWRGSTVRQEFSLGPDGGRIDIRLAIDWHEQHRMLKYSVPVVLRDAILTAEVPGGTLARTTTGEEDPCYRWLDLTGTAAAAGGETTYGLALLNDSKYGYSCQGSDLRLSLLRSPIACFHDPAKPEPGREYLFLDQGEQVVRLALVPHAGPWQDAGLAAEADALHHPPVHLFQYPHAGEWAARQSLLDVAPGGVSVLALKGAEDGPGLILRLFETAGRAVEAQVRVGEWSFPLALGAHEIRTLRLHPETRRVHEVNLLEEAGA